MKKGPKLDWVREKICRDPRTELARKFPGALYAPRDRQSKKLHAQVLDKIPLEFGDQWQERQLVMETGKGRSGMARLLLKRPHRQLDILVATLLKALYDQEFDPPLWDTFGRGVPSEGVHPCDCGLLIRGFALGVSQSAPIQLLVDRFSQSTMAIPKAWEGVFMGLTRLTSRHDLNIQGFLRAALQAYPKQPFDIQGLASILGNLRSLGGPPSHAEALLAVLHSKYAEGHGIPLYYALLNLAKLNLQDAQLMAACMPRLAVGSDPYSTSQLLGLASLYSNYELPETPDLYEAIGHQLLRESLTSSEIIGFLGILSHVRVYHQGFIRKFGHPSLVSVPTDDGGWELAKLASAFLGLDLQKSPVFPHLWETAGRSILKFEWAPLTGLLKTFGRARHGSPMELVFERSLPIYWQEKPKDAGAWVGWVAQVLAMDLIAGWPSADLENLLTHLAPEVSSLKAYQVTQICRALLGLPESSLNFGQALMGVAPTLRLNIRQLIPLLRLVAPQSTPEFSEFVIQFLQSQRTPKLSASERRQLLEGLLKITRDPDVLDLI